MSKCKVLGCLNSNYSGEEGYCKMHFQELERISELKPNLICLSCKHKTNFKPLKIRACFNNVEKFGNDILLECPICLKLHIFSFRFSILKIDDIGLRLYEQNSELKK